MKEAYLYEKSADQKVKCHVCSHECLIKPGAKGICCVRENQGGVLYTLVYDKIIAQNIDPIEKKPIFHMLPGSLSYSIATVGCNFRCMFCQNANIAQMPSDTGMIAGRAVTPQKIVEAALNGGCQSIAYTYTEPTVYFELAYDTARLAHEKGLKNIWVSNGYMTDQALDMIAPYLDAANIDLKGFSDEFYKTYCKARLTPVKNTLIKMKKKGILLEVTTLIIPNANDDADQLKNLADFIAQELGTDTPWHISRFHPSYNLQDRDATHMDSLILAREIGRDAGLDYVYLGNVPGKGGESTLCPKCKINLVSRMGFNITGYFIKNGKCPDCSTKIYGIWE